MNIFELDLVASPAGGLAGALMATKECTAASQVLAGVIGLGVGIALYFGTFGFVMLAAQITGILRPRRIETPCWGTSVVGLLVLLPMIVLPLISLAAAHWVAGCICA
jgi:hypothetical protein